MSTFFIKTPNKFQGHKVNEGHFFGFFIGIFL